LIRPVVQAVIYVVVEVMEQLYFARRVDHKISYIRGAQPCEPRSCNTGVCFPVNVAKFWQSVPLIEPAKHVFPLQSRDPWGFGFVWWGHGSIVRSFVRCCSPP
jgi:hypothetical protein